MGKQGARIICCILQALKKNELAKFERCSAFHGKLHFWHNYSIKRAEDFVWATI